ncbi:MAG: hypothetical protein R2792_12140 [Saprospiraceae bacterium]
MLFVKERDICLHRLVKGIIKNAELEKKYKRFSTPKFSLEESLQTLLPREHEVLKKVLQGDSPGRNRKSTWLFIPYRFISQTLSV